MALFNKSTSDNGMITENKLMGTIQDCLGKKNKTDSIRLIISLISFVLLLQTCSMN